MILVIYTAIKIDAVSEAQQGGITHHSKNKMPFVGTIEDAKDFFQMKGFDPLRLMNTNL
jgi:hypothetical protein